MSLLADRTAELLRQRRCFYRCWKGMEGLEIGMVVSALEELAWQLGDLAYLSYVSHERDTALEEMSSTGFRHETCEACDFPPGVMRAFSRYSAKPSKPALVTIGHALADELVRR